MITKIEMKDVASYDAEGVVFDNLQEVSVIYGGNGTGKTTLSRFLAGPDNSPDIIDDGDGHKNIIQLSEHINIVVDGNLNGLFGDLVKKNQKSRKKIDYRIFDHCKMEWEGGRKEVMVYNQDFKQRNLTEIMPGVFTIGPEGKKRKKKEPYSVKPAMDYINETLSRIGFTGFTIRTSKENAYTYEIVRKDGSQAGQTLSEGEVAIITFLYFIEQVAGLGSGSNPYGQKVVVVDDPISSLDYDTIDVVSQLTSEMMDSVRTYGRIEQVIVLTHNTTFHQTLSIRQPQGSIYYWKLFKKKGVSKVISCGRENPVRSDYEELWMKLRDIRKEMDEGGNVCVMDLPNTMRRIIETYFADCGGYNKRKMFDGVYAKSKEEKQAMTALAKWFDEGSHGVGDNLYAGNEEMMCERYMDAFRRLFETMGQGAHYCMMMREGRHDMATN